MIKQSFRYGITFLTVTFLLMSMLVLSARIPRSAIRGNVQKSAEYLCEGELFGALVEGVNGSRIDHYADSILLAIAYRYDADKPLTSVMWSSYYYSELCNENENLLSAVANDYEANQQYMRYWHGSNVLVRPLLTVCNLQQIYVLNAIVLVLLTILLLAILVRQKAFFPVVGVIMGLVLTSAWFVPFSLEYTWTYLLMLLFSVIGVCLVTGRRYAMIGTFFLVNGMITNFMDFLTTETLTLTVPLLLMLWMSGREEEKNIGEKQKKNPPIVDWSGTSKGAGMFWFAGKAAIFWGIGYVGMWLMKWLLASVVLSENVMPYVTEHIGERLGADPGIGFFAYMFGAIWKNLRCLFPFEYGMTGVIAGVALLVVLVYVGYVYHAKDTDWKCVLLYALVGLIPYIRYAVLRNHAYLHCFFTYRAQMATVLAVVLILERITEGMLLVNEKGRKL